MPTNIITAPLTPQVSLGLQLNVTTGRNQVQRRVGSYAALYMVPNSRVVDTQIELGVGETYYSTPGETTNNLILSTSAALNFLGSRAAGGTLTQVVNRVLVLDDPLTSYSFTNSGAAPVIVGLNAVNVTNLTPIPPVYYGASVLPAAFDAAFITGLSNSVEEDKNQTVVITAGPSEFLFYCYPIMEGQSQFTVNGFAGGMGVVATTMVQTPQGLLQYYVYKSDNPNLGATTLIVSDGGA